MGQGRRDASNGLHCWSAGVGLLCPLVPSCLKFPSLALQIGPALGAEVRKLVQLGMKAPNDFWVRLDLWWGRVRRKSWQAIQRVELWWQTCRQAIQRVACTWVCVWGKVQLKVQLHVPGHQLGLSPFLPPCAPTAGAADERAQQYHCLQQQPARQGACSTGAAAGEAAGDVADGRAPGAMCAGCAIALWSVCVVGAGATGEAAGVERHKLEV